MVGNWSPDYADASGGSADAAGAIAIVNASGAVLLVRPSEHGGGHGGDWTYPQAVIENHESPAEAARREAQDAIGLTLDPDRHAIYPIARYYTSPDGFGAVLDLTVYVAHIADVRGASPPSVGQVEDSLWIQPDDAIHAAVRRAMPMLPSGMFGLQRLADYLEPSPERTYAEVLMGGTFDRLHDGHKHLLAAAFDIGDYVYIGVTTDDYIAASKKEAKDKIEPHAVRIFNLRGYLRQCGQLHRAILLPLGDVAGPKSLDPTLGALIVSEDTVGGGNEVNDRRVAADVKPLEMIVVPLVRDSTGTISSTRLRTEHLPS